MKFVENNLWLWKYRSTIPIHPLYSCPNLLCLAQNWHRYLECRKIPIIFMILGLYCIFVSANLEFVLQVCIFSAYLPTHADINMINFISELFRWQKKWRFSNMFLVLLFSSISFSMKRISFFKCRPAYMTASALLLIN